VIDQLDVEGPESFAQHSPLRSRYRRSSRDSVDAEG
jgi:hypothetical protein